MDSEWLVAASGRFVGPTLSDVWAQTSVLVPHGGRAVRFVQHEERHFSMVNEKRAERRQVAPAVARAMRAIERLAARGEPCHLSALSRELGVGGPGWTA